MFFVRRAPRAAAFVTTAATIATLAAGVAATSAHAVVGPDLQLTGVRLAPATVDVTKTVNDVAVVLKVTDNGTGFGVDGADVTAECLTGCPVGTPALTSSSVAFQAGPAGNQTVTVSLQVPVATPASAQWVIDNVVLHNFSTPTLHDRVYTDANLTSGGFARAGRTFTVASTPDTTPPALVGAPTISPASVNVTQSDQPATFLLHLTDNSNANQSGVNHGSITLASGAVTKTFDFTTNNNTDADPTIGTLVKGSPFDGFYRFTESFTALDAGTWTLSQIDAVDAQNQSLSLPNVVSWPTLTVVESPDTAAPSLVTASLLAPSQSGSSVTVAATNNDTAATLVTHILDTDGSGGAGVGFDHGSASFLDSASGLTLDVDIAKTDQTAAATPGVDNGKWETRVPVSARQTAGDYLLQSLTLVDRLGHSATLTSPAASLPALHIHVTSTPDAANGPSLVSFSLSAAHVNVNALPFSTGHTAAIVHVTDDVSGFYSGQLTLTDRNDATNQVFVFIDRSNVLPGSNVNGDFKNASYRVDIEPAVAGTYDVTELDLNDVASQNEFTGITTILDGSQVAAQAAGGPTSIVAVDNGADTTAPTIVSATIAPSTTVDASNGFQKVTVMVNATDSGGTATATGVSGINLELRSVTGANSATFNVFADGSSNGCFAGPNIVDASPCLDGLVSGDFASGTYQVTAYVPQWAVAGNWVLDNADILDGAGNDRFYTTNPVGGGADVSAIGGSHTFSVTGTSDVTAPTVQSLSIDPTSVTSNGTDAFVANGTVRVTDTQSGVRSVTVGFSTSDGTQQTQFANLRALTPADPLNTTFAFTVTFPRFPESGNWVAAVHALDVVGNQTDLTGPALTNAGLLSQIPVAGLPDTTAPALAGISVDSSTVNSTAAAQSVVVDVHATDAGSGFSGSNVSCNVATLDVTDNHGHVANVDTCATSFIGGNPNDAWYQLPVNIGQYNTGGTWTITAVHLLDQAGNATVVPENIALTVTSASDLAAPTAASVSFDKSAVDVTSAAGQVAITAHLLDNATGVASAVMDFVKPDNTHVQVNLTRTGGLSATNGTWTGTLVIPQVTGAGSWTTNTLDLLDIAANEVVLTPAQVTTAGAPASITATGPVAPVAAFTQSTTAVLVNGSVHFDGNGSTGTNATITSYQWNFGDGTGATGATADHVYSSAGQYTPTLTVTDSHNLQNAKPGTQISVGTLPGQPTGMSATTGVNSAVVSWGAAPGTVSSYTLLVKDGGSVVQTINPASSPTTVSALTSGKTYTFDVVANNGFGAGPAAETQAIAGGPANVGLTTKPAGVTPASSASFGFTASPGSTVACTLDGVAGACTSGSTAVYNGLAQGVHSFVVTATDAAAQQATASYTWRVDSTAPSVAMSRPSTTTSLARPIVVSWSGSDAGGLASYDVRYAAAAWNGKLGAPVTWKSATTATSATLTGALGSEYCFSVRARDVAGNVSGWSAAKCTAVPLDDRALTASKGWKKMAGKAFLNGTAMQAAAKGKTLTKKGAATGRAVLYVDKGKGFGTISVLYNGKVVKKISLASTKTVTKFAVALPKITKTTTVVIKTTSAKKVQIDGLLLARV